jgi:putative colanic acid biosynthesis acetyltransferase WcaF
MLSLKPLSINTDPFVGPCFSITNRLARVVWNTVCLLFFRPSPKPFHSWRCFLLRLFGAKIGKGCHIYPKATIWAPWMLECGDETGIANGVNVYNQAHITLGRRCVISQGTHLCTGSHDYESPHFSLIAKPIIIGNQVWIAAECFVHPKVHIGEGAVIGARSVVTKDMPSWTVCAGHPCKPIKPRLLNSTYDSDFDFDPHAK